MRNAGKIMKESLHMKGSTHQVASGGKLKAKVLGLGLQRLSESIDFGGNSGDTWSF